MRKILILIGLFLLTFSLTAQAARELRKDTLTLSGNERRKTETISQVPCKLISAILTLDGAVSGRLSLTDGTTESFLLKTEHNVAELIEIGPFDESVAPVFTTNLQASLASDSHVTATFVYIELR